MIKNIIFDFDGVLVDTEILVAKAFAKYMLNFGIEINEKEFGLGVFGKSLSPQKLKDNELVKIQKSGEFKFGVINKNSDQYNLLVEQSQLLNEEDDVTDSDHS